MDADAPNPDASHQARPPEDKKPKRSFWARQRRGALRATILLAVAMILFVSCQSKLIYHPTDELVETPAAYGLAYEDVFLTTEDGLRLHAWYLPAKPVNQPPRATILLLHGNAGNISHRMSILTMLHELGLATLILDYRGYGRSEGSPDEEGTYRDARAGWNYLTITKQARPERVLIMGRSLGGAIAAHLAAEHQPGALILDSAFTSAPDMAQEMIPLLPRFLCRFDYNTLASVESIAQRIPPTPVLIFHASDDDIVPYAHSQRLLNAASEPKQHLKTQGGHNRHHVQSRQDYLTTLDAFLTKHLKK